MKTLWKFILAVLAGAFGTLLAIAFQGPVLRYFNQDRLVMNVYAGPWSPFIAADRDLQREMDRQGLSTFLRMRFQNGDEIYSARIVLENPGTKTVDHIRIALNEYGPQDWLIFEEGHPPRTISGQREIQVTALGPGQHALLYTWGYQDLTSPYEYTDWRTFSSEGPADLRLNAPVQSTPGASIETAANWMGIVMFALFGLGLLLSVGGVAYMQAYVKQLFADENHYLNERLRYEANPKKFDVRLRPQ